MTTTDNTTEVNLAAWCAQRADNHTNYEHAEMALYPTGRDRDIALIEWTVRALGNPLLADSRQVLAAIAEQHGLELAPAGELDRVRADLAAAHNHAHRQDTEIQRLTRDGIAYANENAELKRQLGSFEALLNQTQDRLAEANRAAAGTYSSPDEGGSPLDPTCPDCGDFSDGMHICRAEAEVAR